MAKGKRHKWDKSMYHGKYSSFELEATCTKCGCQRSKMAYGYRYDLPDGTHQYDKAPPCVES